MTYSEQGASLPEGEHESLQDAERSAGRAAYWLRQIEDAGRTEKDWRRDAKKLIERYENRDGSKTQLNIFAGNVAVLQPAVYSRKPRPQVRRRTPHENPASNTVGQQAAQALQRSLVYLTDDGFHATMKAVRDDGLIVGRGVARLDYIRDTEKRFDLQPFNSMESGAPILWMLDGRVVAPDGEEDGRPYVEEVVKETLKTVHVAWSNFRMGPCLCWEECPWVAYRHLYFYEDLIKEFPQYASKIPLNIHTDTEGEDRDNAIKDPKPLLPK